MPHGIVIFGSSGSGKTTLGKMVAEKLCFPYYDIDDYVWRKDTEMLFSVMYSHDEKISRLMNAISQDEHFVMAGSMDSFHASFDPLFELAVHLTADVKIRLERIREREYKLFGDRILEGGDLYESNLRFLDSVSRYDTDGSPNMKTHSLWAETLPCKVLRLDGDDSLMSNCNIIVGEYLRDKGTAGCVKTIYGNSRRLVMQLNRCRNVATREATNASGGASETDGQSADCLARSRNM